MYQFVVSKATWNDEDNSAFDYSSYRNLTSAVIVAEDAAWPTLLAKATSNVDDYNIILNVVEKYKSLDWEHPEEMSGLFMEWLIISSDISKEDYEEYVFSSEYEKWAEDRANNLKIQAWIKARNTIADSILSPIENKASDVDKLLQFVDGNRYPVVSKYDAIKAFAEYAGMTAKDVEKTIKENHISKNSGTFNMVGLLLSAVPNTRQKVWDSVPAEEMAAIDTAYQEYARVAEGIPDIPWDNSDRGSVIKISPCKSTNNYVLIVNGETSEQYCCD